MASLFKKKTVDGEWVPGEAPPAPPAQRPPPALARPRERGWSRRGRGLGPRVPEEPELGEEREGSGRPRAARRDSPAALGRVPGPGRPWHGGAGNSRLTGSVGAGPGQPGPWASEEEEQEQGQHLSLAARETKQARQELLGPRGAGTERCRCAGATARLRDRHRPGLGSPRLCRQLGVGSGQPVWQQSA